MRGDQQGGSHPESAWGSLSVEDLGAWDKNLRDCLVALNGELSDHSWRQAVDRRTWRLGLEDRG